MQNKFNNLIKRWVFPKLPLVHIYPKPSGNKIIFYLKIWVFHPIKRYAAKYYLKLLKSVFGIKVIGITGSAGKTTTKEMLYSILSLRGSTVVSVANIDPVFNIPATIFRCKPSTRYLVLEMGVEYPGEIDFYLWLASTDLAIVTNVYPTHTLFFKNEKGVAKEKGKLVKYLPSDRVAVINNENEFTKDMQKLTTSQVIFFGKGSKYFASNVTFTSDFLTKFTLHINKEKRPLILPMLGQQFVENALAASCASHILEFSIAEITKGLSLFNPPPHRMRVTKHKSGSIIFDETYNNNPVAAKVAIKTFVSVTKNKKRIIVFGDMLELGSLEKRSHVEIGEILAEESNITLITVGKASENTYKAFHSLRPSLTAIHLNNYTQVYKTVMPILDQNTALLIKGSRSMHLDRVVTQLFEGS